ncbi:MAG TPA: GNAT family N-acyltransferase [Terriglobales bacterium]|nr:GNAT family N-acyltransferase [Terriglobales bacterium]
MTTAASSGLANTQSLPLLAVTRVHRELAVCGQYSVLLATTDEERSAIYRLRFRVFNLELNEGLEESFATGEDKDEFDEVCGHLYVQHRITGEVVGTYRVQSGLKAAANVGYYSEREFVLVPFEPLRAQVVELGRACIDRRHRNFEVLNLLWRGLAIYAQGINARYLLGCSSLTSQDPGEGWAVYQQLSMFQSCPELQTVPTAEYYMPPARPKEGAKVPRLLRAYLAVGAQICGTPGLDRNFKTIDFLTLLDFEKLSSAAKARFLR